MLDLNSFAREIRKATIVWPFLLYYPYSMRQAHRVDANHSAIISAFRALGCTVFDTSALGGGFPDLVIGVVGHGGAVNLLVEVKDGEKVPSKQRLTDAEDRFASTWRGQYTIVKSVQEAVKLIGQYKKGAAYGQIAGNNTI